MLDLMYMTLAAFEADCLLCGLDATTLFIEGEYAMNKAGEVMITEWVNA